MSVGLFLALFWGLSMASLGPMLECDWFMPGLEKQMGSLCKFCVFVNGTDNHTKDTAVEFVSEPGSFHEELHLLSALILHCIQKRSLSTA